MQVKSRKFDAGNIMKVYAGKITKGSCRKNHERFMQVKSRMVDTGKIMKGLCK